MVRKVFLVLLAIAVAEYTPSVLSDQSCGTNCNKCWTVAGNITENICAECSSGYFFDIEYISGSKLNKTVCKSPTDFENGKLINGFKRACANCGLRNYLDKDLNCQPCPIGCDSCYSHSDGTCDACYKGAGANDVYDPITDGSCKCSRGGAEQVDGICHCNNPDTYINKTTYECLNCTKCTRDLAKCKASPLGKIPPHEYDEDDKECPKKCHISCDECSGNATTDCNRTTVGLMCRNDLLWEDVKVSSGSAQFNECYCVCNSKETYVDNVPQCTCESPRVKGDSCSADYSKYHVRTCSDFDKMNRYQCICPSGFSDGSRNSSGYIPCVPRKYSILYPYSGGLAGYWYVFIDNTYWTNRDSVIRQITDGFLGIWPGGFDSVLNVNGGDYYWFFRGNETIYYYKPSTANGTVQSGYPKNISDVWKGNSDVSFIDSASYDNYHGYYCLTKGTVVYLYDTNLKFIKTQTMEQILPGISAYPDFKTLDSATLWYNGNYYYYLFKGNSSILYFNGAYNSKNAVAGVIGNIPPLFY